MVDELVTLPGTGALSKQDKVKDEENVKLYKNLVTGKMTMDPAFFRKDGNNPLGNARFLAATAKAFNQSDSVS